MSITSNLARNLGVLPELHAWGADILSYGEKCESVTYPGGILVLTSEGVDPGFCPEGIADACSTRAVNKIQTKFYKLF